MNRYMNIGFLLSESWLLFLAVCIIIFASIKLHPLFLLLLPVAAGLALMITGDYLGG